MVDFHKQKFIPTSEEEAQKISELAYEFGIENPDDALTNPHIISRMKEFREKRKGEIISGIKSGRKYRKKLERDLPSIFGEDALDWFSKKVADSIVNGLSEYEATSEAMDELKKIEKKKQEEKKEEKTRIERERQKIEEEKRKMRLKKGLQEHRAEIERLAQEGHWLGRALLKDLEE